MRRSCRVGDGERDGPVAGLHGSRRVFRDCRYHAIDRLFLIGYIPSVEWEVEYTDEFEEWWNRLTEAEQEELASKVNLLMKYGPALKRPHSDVITTSRHANMKELRATVDDRRLRVLYAFDPRRKALLLIGGDKVGDAKWYDRMVPQADDLFNEHLKALEREHGNG